MPSRKEIKETVTYPPSKRKAPPFKPQIPSKLPRTNSTTSERLASVRDKSVERTNTRPNITNASTLHHGKDGTHSKAASRQADLISDSDEDEDVDADLPDNPLTFTTQHIPEMIQSTRVSSLPDLTNNDLDIRDQEEIPPDIDEAATIPQALLLRLMHENFESTSTKIDKHAAVVLQKYVDVFIRETIARARNSKQEEVEAGMVSQSDASWLDRKDLEKVAGSMLMDF